MLRPCACLHWRQSGWPPTSRPTGLCLHDLQWKKTKRIKLKKVTRHKIIKHSFRTKSQDISSQLTSDFTHSILHGVDGQGFETKLCASTGKRLNDSSDIVAYQAKSSDFGIGFNDATKSRLCIRSHCIHLIQHNNLESRTRISPE